MKLLLALLVSLMAIAPAGAASGKVAVGIAPGAHAAEVAAVVQVRTGGVASLNLAALDAITVRVADVDQALRQLRSLPGTTYVERLDRARRLAFTPDDPLLARQWHLPLIGAFDAWPEPPVLGDVLVAVIDSGIDGAHPELMDRIEEARSFVSSAATTDSIGHGTMVAGEIAAATNNAGGIAAPGLSVRPARRQGRRLRWLHFARGRGEGRFAGRSTAGRA